MTENGHRDQTAKQNTGRWIAYGAILAGVICTVVGVAILSWTPEAPAAAANTHPTSAMHPQEVTSPLNTLVILSPPPSATALPKPSTIPTVTPKPSTTPTVAPKSTLPPQVTPTPVQLTGGLFHLAIVHSNDTWGYTLPCG